MLPRPPGKAAMKITDENAPSTPNLLASAAPFLVIIIKHMILLNSGHLPFFLVLTPSSIFANFSLMIRYSFKSEK